MARKPWRGAAPATVALPRPRFAHPQVRDAVVDLDHSLERTAHDRLARHAQQRELVAVSMKDVEHEVATLAPAGSAGGAAGFAHLTRAQAEQLLDRVEMRRGLVAHQDPEAAEAQEGLLERRRIDAELVLERRSASLSISDVSQGTLPSGRVETSRANASGLAAMRRGMPASHHDDGGRGAFLVLPQRPQLALEHRRAAQEVEIGQPIGREWPRGRRGGRCRRGGGRAPRRATGTVRRCGSGPGTAPGC